MATKARAGVGLKSGASSIPEPGASSFFKSPKDLSCLLLLFQAISGELDPKWSSWDFNWHPNRMVPLPAALPVMPQCWPPQVFFFLTKIDIAFNSIFHELFLKNP